MNWILPYIFSLLAFLGTFFFIRIIGKIVRQLYPKSKTVDWDNLKITVVRATPTLVLGILLLILRNWFGWIWISASAIWASLIWDGLHLIFTAYYVGKLRSLRRNPASFFYQVKVEPYDDWANTNLFKVTPFKFWLRGLSLPILLQPFSFIFTFFSSGKTPLGILYGDFQRFLRNDFRYVDVFDDIDGKLGFSEEELWSVPHLAVKNADAYKREISRMFSGMFGDAVEEEIKKRVVSNKINEQTTEDMLGAMEPDEDESKISQRADRSTSKSFLTNRAINSTLPAELWETSCRLCQTTPPIIADTWKLYHFQEDIRLRLVLLFNAADLLQRLVGAMVLKSLNETGELDSLLDRLDFPRRDKSDEPLFPPNTGGDWNKVLHWTLKNSQSKELEIFRQILLKPRPDFAASLEKLAPFWQILQTAPYIPPDENTLAAFSILAQLRNKTIGHGAIGWKLQLRPAIYLSALHHFFLAAMRDVSNLNLGVVTYQQVGEEWKVISVLQGLFANETEAIAGECGIMIENPANDDFLDLYPFLRFYDGRLLVVDRFSKDQSAATYIDYNAENIIEPSFVTLGIG